MWHLDPDATRDKGSQWTLSLMIFVETPGVETRDLFVLVLFTRCLSYNLWENAITFWQKVIAAALFWKKLNKIKFGWVKLRKYLDQASFKRLTGIFKVARLVHLNAPSALKIGGRFKNATPVTLSAFEAFFLIFCLIHNFCRMGWSFRHPAVSH